MQQLTVYLRITSISDR